MPEPAPSPQWITFSDTVVGIPQTPFPLYSAYLDEFIEFILKLILAASVVWISAIQTLSHVRKVLAEEPTPPEVTHGP